MKELQPAEAKLIFQAVFAPAVENEHRITKAIVGAIPPDKSDYHPDEISKGALDAAWHLVVTEMRFMRAVAAGEFDFSPLPRPESIQTSADLNAWYSEHFEKAFQALQPLSGEQLTKTMNFRGMFEMPAVMFLGFMLHHSVHHRGQLTMYLRPMGAKVPSIYGESYDAAEARKAREQKT